MLDSFARFAGPRPGQRTLDVGCGPGALVRRLAALGCQAVGVDADAAMIERARELASADASALAAEFRLGDVLALPFEAAWFDLVTASNLIFLLREPQAGLNEMARVVAPGGVLAMLNPSPRLSRASAQDHAEAEGLEDFDAFSLAGWGSVAENHRRFSPAEIGAMFEAAGLQLEEMAEKIGPGLAIFARARKARSGEH